MPLRILRVGVCKWQCCFIPAIFRLRLLAFMHTRTLALAHPRRAIIRFLCGANSSAFGGWGGGANETCGYAQHASTACTHRPARPINTRLRHGTVPSLCFVVCSSIAILTPSSGSVVYNQREEHITVNFLLSCVITIEYAIAILPHLTLKELYCVHGCER
jgi:hypothetical protein